MTPEENNLISLALARNAARKSPEDWPDDSVDPTFADQMTLIRDLSREDLIDVTVSLSYYVAMVTETLAELLGTDAETLLQSMVEQNVLGDDGSDSLGAE